MDNLSLVLKNSQVKYIFVVLSYNQEDYIIEHLESIKYQIEKFSKGRQCGVVIADDGSRDRTLQFAKTWLNVHQTLFVTTKVLESNQNQGTCANYVRVFPYVKGAFFKVVAADDVYSCENIFDLMESVKVDRIVSGLPIMLTNGSLSVSNVANFNYIASELLYAHNFLGAMRGLSSIHTPSLAYWDGALEVKGIEDFMNGFSVVEDFSMQAWLATNNKNVEYKLFDKYYIYYRRTVQSTYIIKNNAFIRDKTNIYIFLKKLTRNPIKRLLISNRIMCLRMGRSPLRHIINLNMYVYGFSLLPKITRIITRLLKINNSMDAYRQHYSNVCVRAKEYLAKMD